MAGSALGQRTLQSATLQSATLQSALAFHPLSARRAAMHPVRKDKPPRLPLIFAQATPPLYLVTFNTHLRRPLLACTEVHAAFRAFAERAEEHRIGVGRYVLMPDHAHLFVRVAGEMTLGAWVKALKRTLGAALGQRGVASAVSAEDALGQRTLQPPTPAHRAGERLRSFWQPGFHDHLLRHDESYAQKWHYVWMNPVRAGLVSAPEEWPYQGEVVRIDRA